MCVLQQVGQTTLTLLGRSVLLLLLLSINLLAAGGTTIASLISNTTTTARTGQFVADQLTEANSPSRALAFALALATFAFAGEGAVEVKEDRAALADEHGVQGALNWLAAQTAGIVAAGDSLDEVQSWWKRKC